MQQLDSVVNVVNTLSFEDKISLFEIIKNMLLEKNTQNIIESYNDTIVLFEKGELALERPNELFLRLNI